jgi:hypothetical protein
VGRAASKSILPHLNAHGVLPQHRLHSHGSLQRSAGAVRRASTPLPGLTAHGVLPQRRVHSLGSLHRSGGAVRSTRTSCSPCSSCWALPAKEGRAAGKSILPRLNAHGVPPQHRLHFHGSLLRCADAVCSTRTPLSRLALQGPAGGVHAARTAQTRCAPSPVQWRQDPAAQS